jgi:hypothetical protein
MRKRVEVPCSKKDINEDVALRALGMGDTFKTVFKDSQAPSLTWLVNMETTKDMFLFITYEETHNSIVLIAHGFLTKEHIIEVGIPHHKKRKCYYIMISNLHEIPDDWFSDTMDISPDTTVAPNKGKRKQIDVEDCPPSWFARYFDINTPLPQQKCTEHDIYNRVKLVLISEKTSMPFNTWDVFTDACSFRYCMAMAFNRSSAPTVYIQGEINIMINRIRQFLMSTSMTDADTDIRLRNYLTAQTGLKGDTSLSIITDYVSTYLSSHLVIQKDIQETMFTMLNTPVRKAANYFSPINYKYLPPCLVQSLTRAAWNPRDYKQANSIISSIKNFDVMDIEDFMSSTFPHMHKNYTRMPDSSSKNYVPSCHSIMNKWFDGSSCPFVSMNNKGLKELLKHYDTPDSSTEHMIHKQMMEANELKRLNDKITDVNYDSDAEEYKLTGGVIKETGYSFIDTYVNSVRNDDPEFSFRGSLELSKDSPLQEHFPEWSACMALGHVTKNFPSEYIAKTPRAWIDLSYSDK